MAEPHQLSQGFFLEMALLNLILFMHDWLKHIKQVYLMSLKWGNKILPREGHCKSFGQACHQRAARVYFFPHRGDWKVLRIITQSAGWISSARGKRFQSSKRGVSCCWIGKLMELDG